MTTLNTHALTNVVRTLEAGLTELKLAQPGSVHYELYRNSVVKSFELAVEIAGKLLRKALKAFLGDPRAVDAMVFNEVLRHAGKHGVFDPAELERWLAYRQQRNATAHDYGEKLAEKAVDLLSQFTADARDLAVRLQNIFDAQNDD